jgi:ATP-dependent Clp protease ATP-binding subunit ClpC
MFERFNEHVRRSLFFARYEASRASSRSIATQHVLLGMLREADPAFNRLLSDRGIDVRELREELLGDHVALERVSTSPDLPLAEESKKALAFAVHEAESMGHASIDSEHLVLHIAEYSRDLTMIAAEGGFDPLIGREQEVERMVQILSRRTKNNPLLLGESGVGKTAIVEGLASRIVDGSVPMLLADRRILALDLSLLVAGTKYRGQFEERLKGLLKELQDHPEIIIFLDEIHTLIGTGSAEGSLDAANIIKPALSRGEITCRWRSPMPDAI